MPEVRVLSGGVYCGSLFAFQEVSTDCLPVVCLQAVQAIDGVLDIARALPLWRQDDLDEGRLAAASEWVETYLDFAARHLYRVAKRVEDSMAADCFILSHHLERGEHDAARALWPKLKARLQIITAKWRTADPSPGVVSGSESGPPLPAIQDSTIKPPSVEARAARPNAPTADVPPLRAEQLEKIIDADVLDVLRSDDSADHKMNRICGIDRRYLDWESPAWAELLGVSGQAIRKTPFWLKDRARLIGRD